MLLHMVRTTIRLSPDLMRQLRHLAAESRRTLTSIIEDAVREVLARKNSKQLRKRVVLPTFKGNGVRPGVDLHNNANLLDIMDGL